MSWAMEKIEYYNCPRCQGYGKIHQPPFFVVSCKHCKGSGHIDDAKRQTIDRQTDEIPNN